MSEIYELAKKIKEAGRIIAKDHLYKDYYIDGNRSPEAIIVTSDSGYEAIYIGSVSNSLDNGYMCLYTNNTSKRNSFPSAKEIARLLTLVAKGEKLPEGNGKAKYYEIYGDMKEQLKYFSEVVCKMAGIENPKYKLEAANAEDEKYIYRNFYSKDCGYIGHLRGDFGIPGTEYWTTWHNGTDALNTSEFRTEFDELERYLKEQSSIPILKDRSTMRHICELHRGFKLADKFADIHLYKVVTAKYTYFIRCFYGTGDYNFYIFAYNNEKLRKHKDSLLVEKYSDVLDKDKFFKTDSGFTHVYYNPDVTAGGQLVYNEISHSIIWDALADDMRCGSFFEYLGSECKQYLVDIGTEDFHDSFMDFVNNDAEFEGCTEETMQSLQEAAYKTLYSYSVDDNNVMTVMEGCSTLCTISDVAEENAEDMFREVVFEMRGISLDEDMEEE